MIWANFCHVGRTYFPETGEKLSKEIKASQKMNSYPWNTQNGAPKIRVGLYRLSQRAIR